jgi:hypothetical protein
MPQQNSKARHSAHNGEIWSWIFRLLCRSFKSGLPSSKPLPPDGEFIIRNKPQRLNMSVQRLRRLHAEGIAPKGGELAEIFLNNAKAGSHSDSAAKDSAIVCSLALQHGVPLKTIRPSLIRDSHGKASSPLGCALDIIAAEEGGEP